EQAGAASALAERLVVPHEEQLVLTLVDLRQPYRPGQREPVLVPLEGVLHGPQRSERIAGSVQFVIAQEFESGAVVLIRAGLGQHVDLRSLSSELGRVDA